MDKLTDFTDTTDVSDAAIDWVRVNAGYGDAWTAYAIRRDCVEDVEGRAIIIAARLIEAHRPELLVDPVDAIVREELAKAWESNQAYAGANQMTADEFRNGLYDDGPDFAAAKRLYQMGLEAGKGQDNA